VRSITCAPARDGDLQVNLVDKHDATARAIIAQASPGVEAIAETCADSSVEVPPAAVMSPSSPKSRPDYDAQIQSKRAQGLRANEGIVAIDNGEDDPSASCWRVQNRRPSQGCAEDIVRR